MKICGRPKLRYTILLLSISVACPSCKRKEETAVSAKSSPEPATVEYYGEHSAITDPNRFSHLYEILPDTIPELCQVVQGLLLHVMHTHRYGVTLTEQKKQEVRLREVESILQRAVELSRQPLTQPRDPNNRVVSHCRDYAVLLCSFLRHQRIAARVRAGFATYFDSYSHQTHWLCEYWCPKRMKWILVDAQLDDIQSKHYKIDFDPLDVPADRFLYAGEEFTLLKENDDRYDLVRSLIQDLAALNKNEVEIWDTTDFMDMREHQNPEALSLLKRVAEITTLPGDRLSELQMIYNNHSELQIPLGHGEPSQLQ